MFSTANCGLTNHRLTFYYPVVGLINLFVHVLKYPALPTTQSDIVLMDIVVGHFARLEFATSGQLAFPFVRELSRLARKAVKKAQLRTQSHDGRSRMEGLTGINSSFKPPEPEMISINHQNTVNDVSLSCIDVVKSSWANDAILIS